MAFLTAFSSRFLGFFFLIPPKASYMDNNPSNMQIAASYGEQQACAEGCILLYSWNICICHLQGVTLSIILKITSVLEF